MANAEWIKPVGAPSIVATLGGTAAGYAPANMLRDPPGVIWRSAGGSATIILDLDFGVDTVLDRLMMFGVTGLPTNANIAISASTSAAGPVYSGWSQSAALFYAGTVRGVDGRGVAYHKFTQGGAPAAMRYWRLSITNAANAVVDVGRVVMGKGVTTARNFSFGGGFGQRDFSRVDFGETGNLLRVRRAKRLRTIGIDFPLLHPDEKETLIDPFLWEVGTDTPVGLITDPDADTYRERKCSFGHLEGSLDRVWRTSSGYAWRAEMTSLY